MSAVRKPAVRKPVVKKPASKNPALKSTGPKRKSVSKKASPSKSRGPLFLIDVSALRSRSRRRRLVLASLLLLVGAFFGVALVQAQLVQTQSEVDTLQAEINRLENDLALIDRQVVEASSPEIIVDRARKLGMVRAVRPVYLVATRSADPTSSDEREDLTTGKAEDAASSKTGSTNTLSLDLVRSDP